MDWLLYLYVVKRTGTRRRYMVQICIAIYLPVGTLSQRAEVSVKVCLGEIRAWLFQAAPCLSMPARRASLWGCPGKLCWLSCASPWAGECLWQGVFLRKCQVLILCKVIIFDLHLLYFGLVSYRTNFRQEQYVLESTGKFQLNLAETEITTKLNSYLFLWAASECPDFGFLS